MQQTTGDNPVYKWITFKMTSTTTCEVIGSTTICVKEEFPYTIDLGTSVMLGGILVFLIAHWFVGLVRYRTKN